MAPDAPNVVHIYAWTAAITGVNCQPSHLEEGLESPYFEMSTADGDVLCAFCDNAIGATRHSSPKAFFAVVLLRTMVDSDAALIILVESKGVEDMGNEPPSHVPGIPAEDMLYKTGERIGSILVSAKTFAKPKKGHGVDLLYAGNTSRIRWEKPLVHMR